MKTLLLWDFGVLGESVQPILDGVAFNLKQKVGDYGGTKFQFHIQVVYKP